MTEATDLAGAGGLARTGFPYQPWLEPRPGPELKMHVSVHALHLFRT